MNGGVAGDRGVEEAEGDGEVEEEETQSGRTATGPWIRTRGDRVWPQLRHL